MATERRVIEVRGLKARLLQSIVDWEKVENEPTSEVKWPVVKKNDKILELRPGRRVPITKQFERFNIFYLQGVGPVDFVPFTESFAKIIKRWKYKI